MTVYQIKLIGTRIGLLNGYPGVEYSSTVYTKKYIALQHVAEFKKKISMSEQTAMNGVKAEIIPLFVEMKR